MAISRSLPALLLALLWNSAKTQPVALELSGTTAADGSDCTSATQGEPCFVGGDEGGEVGVCHFDYASLLPFCRTDPTECENIAGDYCEEAMEEHRELIRLMGYDCKTRLQRIVDDGAAGIDDEAIPDDTNLDWRVGDVCSDTCDWCDRQERAEITVSFDGGIVPLIPGNFEELLLDELCLVAGYSRSLGEGTTIFGDRDNCTLALVEDDDDDDDEDDEDSESSRRRFLRFLQEDSMTVVVEGNLQLLNDMEEDFDDEESVYNSNDLGLTLVGSEGVTMTMEVDRDYSDPIFGLIWFIVLVVGGLLLICGGMIALMCCCCSKKKPEKIRRWDTIVEGKEAPKDSA